MWADSQPMEKPPKKTTKAHAIGGPIVKETHACWKNLEETKINLGCSAWAMSHDLATTNV